MIAFLVIIKMTRKIVVINFEGAKVEGLNPEIKSVLTVF